MCPHCKVKATTVADLKMHMKKSHSKANRNRLKQRTQAEDLSLLDDSVVVNKMIKLEESEEISLNPQNICDWLPCYFQSSDKGQLIRHMNTSETGIRFCPTQTELNLIK